MVTSQTVLSWWRRTACRCSTTRLASPITASTRARLPGLCCDSISNISGILMVFLGLQAPRGHRLGCYGIICAPCGSPMIAGTPLTTKTYARDAFLGVFVKSLNPMDLYDLRGLLSEEEQLVQ